MEEGLPALVVDSEFDTALHLDVRVVAGAKSFDWKQSGDAVARTSTVVPMTLPLELVEHEDVAGFPLMVFGVMRTDTTSQGIAPLYGMLDASGIFIQTEKPESRPYREAFYPVRERPEAVIELDDDGDDTGLQGGAP